MRSTEYIRQVRDAEEFLERYCSYRQEREASLERYRQERDASLERYRQEREASLERYRQEGEASLERYGQERDASLERYRQEREASLERYRQQAHTPALTVGALTPDAVVRNKVLERIFPSQSSISTMLTDPTVLKYDEETEAYSWAMERPPSEGACSICLEDIASTDLIVVPKCKHAHHTECILKWLKMKDDCPDCRARMWDDATYEFHEQQVLLDRLGSVDTVDSNTIAASRRPRGRTRF